MAGTRRSVSSTAPRSSAKRGRELKASEELSPWLAASNSTTAMPARTSGSTIADSVDPLAPQPCNATTTGTGRSAAAACGSASQAASVWPRAPQTWKAIRPGPPDKPSCQPGAWGSRGARSPRSSKPCSSTCNGLGSRGRAVARRVTDVMANGSSSREVHAFPLELVAPGQPGVLPAIDAAPAVLAHVALEAVDH